MTDFLLEIGTEEIPHWMIPGALAQLAKLDLLGAVAQVDATPRRLVGQAVGLPDRTPDQEQIIKGPPLSAGDKAAAGFAKKQGVELSAMQKVGDYYELRKQVPGRRAIDILAETLPSAIMAIQWPKTMYWVGGKTGPRFIRPIRWLVALLGEEVIPFEIAGAKSGNVTRGHRQLGSSSIPVTIENYESELRKNFVILSSSDRRKKIETEAAALGAKPDADLLETLTFVTEYPTAIRGDFDPSFLALPAEVLTTVLKHHQKTFSIESAPNVWGSGTLAPHFVAIMNTSGDPDGWVKLGNERVIKARFNDAWFFYDLDQKKKLADRVEDLAKVTFHQRLGSYLDKTKRVERIVEDFKGSANAKRAAHLCKADLTTEMVKEFTDLQGEIGGLYARAQQENEFVVQAIYEHYKPLSMEDPIPSTVDGQIVALADKLDTLRECFRVGMVPTGSKDPFALRRAAQGVVKILAEGVAYYPFEQLARDSQDLEAFLLDRARFYFGEKGFAYDEVNAVLATPEIGYLQFARERIKALQSVRPTPNFEPLAASFRRIRKIIPAGFTPERSVNRELLEAGPEVELYEAFEGRGSVGGVLSEVIALKSERKYEEALSRIASLRPRVDAFFDKVMVNVDDPRIRANRLTLLHNLLTEFSTIADFSEIVTAGDKTN